MVEGFKVYLMRRKEHEITWLPFICILLNKKDEIRG
jgi:hypothetical protein